MNKGSNLREDSFLILTRVIIFLIDYYTYFKIMISRLHIYSLRDFLKKTLSFEQRMKSLSIPGTGKIVDDETEGHCHLAKHFRNIAEGKKKQSVFASGTKVSVKQRIDSEENYRNSEHEKLRG